MDERTRGQEIPFDRLPDGFAARVDAPARSPADPRPAATAVLLRDGPSGGDGAAGEIEVLLLRRIGTAGFVPGAFVFPGGRVDADDGSPEALAHLVGSPRAAAPAEELERRLELQGEVPPAAAYLVAAIRETFEETGLLPGWTPASDELAERAARLRRRLLDGEASFSDVLERLDATIDAAAVAYVAHWVTPAAEPRRYDTRFFAMRAPRGRPVRVHPAEISEARWLPPSAALELHRTGKLPMVFPTIRTLEDLRGFRRTDEALDDFRSRSIPRIEPRLVRTPTGVGIEIPEEAAR